MKQIKMIFPDFKIRAYLPNLCHLCADYPKTPPKKTDKFFPQNTSLFSKFFCLNLFPHAEFKPTKGFKTCPVCLHKSCGKMRY